MSLFSQEKYKQHTVSKGETIGEIAKKYHLKTEAIYELNPDAVNGIKPKMVLLIPTKSKKTNTVVAPDTANNHPEKKHEVLPKETLYGIAKQYHSTIDELYKINPDLEKEGLKIGQIINVPHAALEDLATTKSTEKTVEEKKSNGSKKNLPKEEIAASPKAEEKAEIQTEGIQHEILPKESLYSIAKKYGIKLADLQKANPELGNKSLKVGQKINVPVNAETNMGGVAEKAVVKTETKVEKKPDPIQPTKQVAVLPENVVQEKQPKAESTHEVLPKESLYSIAKQHGISLSDLQKANPELGNKSLKVGQKINVPVKAVVGSGLVTEKAVDKKQLVTEKDPSGSELAKQVAVQPQTIVEDKKPETETTHEVLPKETKYGIAKQYGLTVAELEKQNPAIAKKLLVGSVLKIRSSKVVEAPVAVEPVVAKANVELENKALSTNANRVYDSAFVDQLISKASENIGTRYRSGGTTTEGFDCSGLMCYTFSSYDIKLPRSSIEMAAYGSKIDAQNAQKGDLIFFKTRGSGRINHVGMVVEVLDGEIKFIHSATHGGVIISSTKESYYEKNLVQVNRVL